MRDSGISTATVPLIKSQERHHALNSLDPCSNLLQVKAGRLTGFINNRWNAGIAGFAAQTPGRSIADGNNAHAKMAGQVQRCRIAAGNANLRVIAATEGSGMQVDEVIAVGRNRREQDMGNDGRGTAVCAAGEFTIQVTAVGHVAVAIAHAAALTMGNTITVPARSVGSIQLNARRAISVPLISSP